MRLRIVRLLASLAVVAGGFAIVTSPSSATQSSKPSISLVGVWAITGICSGSVCGDTMTISIGGQEAKDPACSEGSYCITDVSGFYGKGVSLTPNGAGTWTWTCNGCTGSEDVAVTFKGDTFSGKATAQPSDGESTDYSGVRVSGPSPSLSVGVSLSSASVAIGKQITAAVTVTAGGADLTGVTLGGGLTSSDVSVAEISGSPDGLSGFSLAAGASRTFSFKVKAKKLVPRV